MGLESAEEPKKYEEAVESENKRDWIAAMRNEMESIEKHKVWDLTPLPPNQGAFETKWVYKIKIDANGLIKTYKAQSMFTLDLLRGSGMEHSKGVKTPAEITVKPILDNSPATNQAEFQSLVGSLLYLSNRTRPDISLAISRVARQTSSPTEQNLTEVKRILRYLDETTDYGILYTKESQSCVGYSDADWAGDVTDRKST